MVISRMRSVVAGILLVSCSGITETEVNSGLRKNSPFMLTTKEQVENITAKYTTTLSTLENKMDLLENNIQAKFLEMETKHGNEIESIKNKLTLMHSSKANIESKFKELFTCLDIDQGKTVILKKGCDLIVNKGNHKVEGVFHVLGTHIIDGGNLHLHDGSGSHDCSRGDGTKRQCNGLGNLIIGHSPQGSKKFHKSLIGSHNIIMGSGHTVSSHGSVVSGVDHTLLGAHASVISGYNNTATSKGSAILGGSSNLAGSIKGDVDSTNDVSGDYATVSGGLRNVAKGDFSSVSGGYKNQAEGDASSVSGGHSNQAEGDSSSVLGGNSNKAVGEFSSVSGEHSNQSEGHHSSV